MLEDLFGFLGSNNAFSLSAEDRLLVTINDIYIMLNMNIIEERWSHNKYI